MPSGTMRTTSQAATRLKRIVNDSICRRKIQSVVDPVVAVMPYYKAKHVFLLIQNSMIRLNDMKTGDPRKNKRQLIQSSDSNCQIIQ
jgi:hypothetical protein